jgi:prevent-host-death family protein
MDTPRARYLDAVTGFALGKRPGLDWRRFDARSCAPWTLRRSLNRCPLHIGPRCATTSPPGPQVWLSSNGTFSDSAPGGDLADAGREEPATPLAKLNFKFNLLAMRTLTILEFRRGASRALKAVERGERFVITYRGRPVARLEPIARTPRGADRDDPIFRIEEFAVDGPGTPLSNRGIDDVLYGR